ncbi:MAG UNVERIFIED_CONTAM: HDIG domain-containing protein [Microcystis novacekii LVE1205-3]
MHCNVELIRTGTLYHDIGKCTIPSVLLKIKWCGRNKHDEINDP